MSNNPEPEQQQERRQQQQPMYKIIFAGCNHTAIKTADDLKNPYRHSKLTNTPVMLCWSCLREEKGACAKSPYHRVVSITEIPPHHHLQNNNNNNHHAHQ